MKLTNELVIEKARESGFDLVGFAKAELLDAESVRLQQWLARGYQAGMGYMERNLDKRIDIRAIFPSARSVISLGINYYQQGNYSEEKAKVSRYAWGKDYHLVIWDKLDQLERSLKEIDNEFSSKSFVDTGPLMDKAWAVRAGLGWMGKHTNIINQEYGSWIFLASIITNYEFDYSPVVNDFCGTCTRCIDACPTQAITESYVLNAGRCISYLTIENKDIIPEEYIGTFNDWVFGCDICQDVCPWNKKFARVNDHQELSGKDNVEFDIEEILAMPEQNFRERFKYSPIRRTKITGLKRNAEFLKKKMILYNIDKSE